PGGDRRRSRDAPGVHPGALPPARGVGHPYRRRGLCRALCRGRPAPGAVGGIDVLDLLPRRGGPLLRRRPGAGHRGLRALLPRDARGGRPPAAERLRGVVRLRRPRRGRQRHRARGPPRRREGCRLRLTCTPPIRTTAGSTWYRVPHLELRLTTRTTACSSSCRGWSGAPGEVERVLEGATLALDREEDLLGGAEGLERAEQLWLPLRGPDREHAPGGDRGEGGGEGRGRVEPLVVLVHEEARSVVHVEEDEVPGAGGLPVLAREDRRDVPGVHADPGVAGEDPECRRQAE